MSTKLLNPGLFTFIFIHFILQQSLIVSKIYANSFEECKGNFQNLKKNNSNYIYIMGLSKVMPTKADAINASKIDMNKKFINDHIGSFVQIKTNTLVSDFESKMETEQNEHSDLLFIKDIEEENFYVYHASYRDEDNKNREGFESCYIGKISKENFKKNFKDKLSSRLNLKDHINEYSNFIKTMPKIKSRVKNKLKITSHPSGATVTINGNFQGKTPTEIIEVDSDAAYIKISMEGYNDFQEQLLFTSKNRTIEKHFVLITQNESHTLINTNSSNLNDFFQKLSSKEAFQQFALDFNLGFSTLKFHDQISQKPIKLISKGMSFKSYMENNFLLAINMRFQSYSSNSVEVELDRMKSKDFDIGLFYRIWRIFLGVKGGLRSNQYDLKNIKKGKYSILDKGQFTSMGGGLDLNNGSGHLSIEYYINNDNLSYTPQKDKVLLINIGLGR